MSADTFFVVADRLARCAHLPETQPRKSPVYQILETKSLDLAGHLTVPEDVERGISCALHAGSVALLKRLSLIPRPKSRKLRPSREDWLDMAPVLSTELMRLAVAQGVEPDEGIAPLVEQAGKDDDLREFVLEDLSRSRFWYWRHSRPFSVWFPIAGSGIASDFVRAQVAHHPKEARKAFCESAPLDSPHGKIVATIWIAAKAVADEDIKRFGDPRDELTKGAKSSHEALKIFEDYSCLERIHELHHEQWRPSLFM